MKIGIITMHKVINFGSLLQAYALQEKIKQLGYENEIIDYDFPPKKNLSLVQRIIFWIYSFLVNVFSLGAIWRKKNRFKRFYNLNIRTTEKLYTNQSIHCNPPVYDIYMSGSDQVWNPNFIKADTSFLLSFAPLEKKHVSYASSFAVNELDENFCNLYAEYLGKYQNICVRERSGVDIVKSLTGKDAQLVCDPTILLTRDDWDKLANKSSLSIDEKYILVYVLNYMFNPYPKIEELIKAVQKELGNLKIIYLEGRKKDVFSRNSKVIKDAGPNEFLYLFKHASFVITTSFHGAAFSLIYGKPLYGVVKDVNSIDGRITSLLNRVGLNQAITCYNSVDVLPKEQLLSLSCSEQALEDFRQYSIFMLQNTLV